MIRLNLDIEKERSELRKAEIRAAADAGVKVVEAQAEAAHHGIMDQAWLSAVQGVDKLSGILWVDAWTKSIRPAMATVALLLIAGNAVSPAHVVLQGVLLEVICGILGLFIGGRIAATGR